jgi:hypothetical protein
MLQWFQTYQVQASAFYNQMTGIAAAGIMAEMRDLVVLMLASKLQEPSFPFCYHCQLVVIELRLCAVDCDLDPSMARVVVCTVLGMPALSVGGNRGIRYDSCSSRLLGYVGVVGN